MGPGEGLGMQKRTPLPAAPLAHSQETLPLQHTLLHSLMRCCCRDCFRPCPAAAAVAGCEPEAGTTASSQCPALGLAIQHPHATIQCAACRQSHMVCLSSRQQATVWSMAVRQRLHNRQNSRRLCRGCRTAMLWQGSPRASDGTRERSEAASARSSLCSDASLLSVEAALAASAAALSSALTLLTLSSSSAAAAVYFTSCICSVCRLPCAAYIALRTTCC